MKPAEYETELRGVFGLDSGLCPLEEEPFKPLVPETSNHNMYRTA